jgi:putative flavoprotein involved in K+ transport
VLDVANVLWCTGFATDYSWIRPSIRLDEFGWPVQYRGVAPTPGLYFLGVLFQYSFTSMLIIGAGRDAAYVVDRIADRLVDARPVGDAVRATTEMPAGRPG